jgi:hypothetical protein
MTRLLLKGLLSAGIVAAQIPESDTILDATVTAVPPRWETTSYGDRIIVSRLTLAVHKVHKGQKVETVDVPGGTLDGLTLRVSHLPLLKKGDRAIFRLDKDGKLDRKKGAAISGVGQAFSTNAFKWPVSQVDYYINPANDDGMDPLQVVAAIQRGADVWSLQTQANFRMRYAGLTVGRSFQPNYINEVFFRPEAPGAIAEAYSWFSGTTTADVDIAYYDGGALFFADQPCANGYYVEDTGAHEFGHFLGLAHTDVPSATMWPFSSPCTVELRTLEADDIAGAEFLYPPSGPPPPPPPPPPSGFTLNVRAFKVKSIQHVELTWTGATTAHVEIRKNGIVLATTPNDGGEIYNLNQKGSGSSTWQVCELSSSVCSPVVTASF